jgi:toxin HigB-1
MIRSFRHKGLARLFLDGDPRGVPPALVARCEARLRAIDLARSVEDLRLPGHRLHPYKGRGQGLWSVDVNGPWRVLFRFVDGDAYDVDLVQPH